MLTPRFQARYQPIVHSSVALDLEPWLPSEFDTRLAGIQPKNLILMHAGNGISSPGRAVAPHLYQLGRDALDRPDVLVARSEVERGSELCILGESP
jgi:hypothetical protein